MELREKLQHIDKELQRIATLKDPLTEGFQVKMDRSMRKYTKAIETNCNYILSCSNHKALKALEKYQSNKEKHGNEKTSNIGFIENY